MNIYFASVLFVLSYITIIAGDDGTNDDEDRALDKRFLSVLKHLQEREEADIERSALIEKEKKEKEKKELIEDLLRRLLEDENSEGESERELENQRKGFFDWFTGGNDDKNDNSGGGGIINKLFNKVKDKIGDFFGIDNLDDLTFSQIAEAFGFSNFGSGSGSMPSSSIPAWKHSDFRNGASSTCRVSATPGRYFRNSSNSRDDLPVPLNCGTNSLSSRLRELLRIERIVGGRQSRKGEWPWLCAIGPKDRGQICGATLISDQWVLSAAHCFSKRESSCKWNVRLGEHDLLKDEAKHADITPEKIIIHPDYDKETNANDIALIKLSRRARLSQDEINVACLPSPRSNIDPNSCVVSGWGTTSSGGRPSAYVQHVKVPLLADSVCKKAYRGAVRAGMMCAGHVTGSKDSCQGDSGGPLVCKDRSNGRYVVAGVVSWGNSCAMEGFPGVYTRVTDFINWIEFVIATS